jgi:aspartate kinase
VSAPGKRNKDDIKVTDLLIGMRKGIEGFTQAQILLMIKERFVSIVKELDLSYDLQADFDELANRMFMSSAVSVMAWGEYTTAKILAVALGFIFIDAARIIRFDHTGTFDMEESMLCANQADVDGPGFVIPGFYGMDPGGNIRTLKRGGSDFTGAVLAAMVGADLYENWTDVSGFRVTDPTIVPEAKHVDVLTYRELRELTYMGARVLHDEVVFPLKRRGIPLLLANTNRPDEKGTLIANDDQVPEREHGSIVGIAGRKGFTAFRIEKDLMNEQVGFLHTLCGVFAKHSVNIEHIPGGIDTLSVIVSKESIDGKLDAVVANLKSALSLGNNELNFHNDLALICTVGKGMAHTPGVASRILKSVAAAGISVKMIDQGSSELSIIIGVAESDYENAVRAIYDGFFPQ